MRNVLIVIWTWGQRWVGEGKGKGVTLTRQETTAFCDTWTQRLFFFSFSISQEKFFWKFQEPAEQTGEWWGAGLDPWITGCGSQWAWGGQTHSLRYGSPEEGLSLFKANHHGSLKILPAHSLPPPCLKNAWKSLQKTKAWRNKACPPRLPEKRVRVSLHPRFSWTQVQLRPALPQHILVPLVSGHQRDTPQKAAGSGWSPVCNRDTFSVWASVCTLTLGSTRVGNRPTAEGNTVVQKIPCDLKEVSSHFPLPSRYPPCTHLNHKAAEDKALALPTSSLSLQLATLRHPNMASPEFWVPLGICAQHRLLLRPTTTVYPQLKGNDFGGAFDWQR